MAEIEHFCDPRDKSHPKFVDVEGVEAVLYSACDQMDGKPAKKVAIGKAVREVMYYHTWSSGRGLKGYFLTLP
jgi:glycyl-tRNA synthetase (class II)